MTGNEAIAEANDSLQKMKITEVEIEEQKHKYEIRRDAILSRITEINKELEEIQKNIPLGLRTLKIP